LHLVGSLYIIELIMFMRSIVVGKPWGYGSLRIWGAAPAGRAGET